MHKLMLASSVALLALSGAALADPNRPSHGGYQSQVPTGTISGQFNYTKTYTNFDKLTNTQTRNDYNGFQGFTSSEHGGKVEVKSNGYASAGGVSVNNSVSNFKGGEISGNVTIPVLGGLSGQVRGLTADSSSVSGGVYAAGSAKGGSASVTGAGYAAGGAGARNETGWSQTQTTDHQWGNSQNWNGSGSLTVAR